MAKTGIVSASVMPQNGLQLPAKTMTDLSLAVEAVVKAIDEVRWDWANMQEADATIIAAAAIRASADQLTPYRVSDYDGAAMARNRLLDIASELEGNKKGA